MIIKLSHYIRCFLKEALIKKLATDRLNECISLIEDDDLLKKDDVLCWYKKNDREPVYNKIFKKSEIKSYGDKVTDFYNIKYPKVDSNHNCFSSN